MSYADAGIKPPTAVFVEIELPDELIEALECDPELSDAFGRLTPGRQKSYVIHLNSAKTPQTRVSREQCELAREIRTSNSRRFGTRLTRWCRIRKMRNGLG
jgi:uncharacterized protein YdeI (YjbR/CyaY-like superfamily)